MFIDQNIHFEKDNVTPDYPFTFPQKVGVMTFIKLYDEIPDHLLYF